MSVELGSIQLHPEGIEVTPSTDSFVTSECCLIDHPLPVAMDDLISVEWTAPKAPLTNQQRPQASGNYYPTLRPTPPLSGRSTLLNVQQSQGPTNNGSARSGPSTPANDSFANLVSFTASQPNKNLSLQEQQRLREEERQKQEVEKRRQFDARFGGTQPAAWDSLGERTTPNRVTSPPTYTATEEYGGQRLSKIINKPFAGIPRASAPAKTSVEEEDLLAAFNAEAPVDKSSYMPPVSNTASIDDLASFGAGPTKSSPSKDLNGTSGGYAEDPDDDPFGLGTGGYVKTSQDAPASNEPNDEDDVLGMLARPVSEFPSKPANQSKAPKDPEPLEEHEVHPQERAVAELVDMGFGIEKSRRALEATESGIDVQAAVGWLLNQAHEDSRKKTRRPSREEDSISKSQSKRTPGRRKSSTSGASKPAWMRDQERSNVNQNRPDSKSPVNGERDSTQYASEIGSKMFKTANSLWKTGTKKLNQAVSEFNSDSDTNQPKWMKDAQPEPIRKPRIQQREHDTNDHDRMGGRLKAEKNVTDEALMLEADSRPRKPRPKVDAPRDPYDSSRDQSPAFSKSQEPVMPKPRFMQQAPARDPRTKLSRQAVEDETAQAYISPARRKRTTPKPTSSEPQPEPDLLFAVTQTQPSAPRPNPSPQPTPATTLPPPKRTIPPLSSFALQASTESRKAGTEAFKRGDYALATSHYSTSLSALPSTHPLIIPLLTNRALSNSKTGDPKASIADAKSALDLIGPSRGVSETIDGGEGVKQMSVYWEKAMTRQAEALEQLERWSEAASVWRTCVEVGVGGATSIAGRNRCERAAAPRVRPSTFKPAPKPRPKPSALGDFAPDSESVTRLRAANAAADRLDDEKFALADVVDSRVSQWRAGKEGNLRALLSTLENVLWEDSGWKKVGMGDVLLPGKVKLVYMKGIAKVHPDKVGGWMLIIDVG